MTLQLFSTLNAITYNLKENILLYPRGTTLVALIEGMVFISQGQRNYLPVLHAICGYQRRYRKLNKQLLNTNK